MIDLDNIKIENRDNQVFYSSESLIVYHDARTIFVSSCAGDILTSSPSPPDFRHFEVCEMDDAVLLMLAGKHVLLLDKHGDQPFGHDLDIARMGRCVTPIFCNQNSILFGTSFKGNIQFIDYDFLEKKRLRQSSSWTANRINYCGIVDNNLCAILDTNTIVSCDAAALDLNWTRFEADAILGDVLAYKGSQIYTCQNTLRFVNKKGSAESVHVQQSTITRLLGVIDNFLYFIDNHTHLVCYDLSVKSVLWTLPGNLPVRDFLFATGKSANKEYNALLLSVENHVVIINLTLGTCLGHLRFDGLARMRKTAGHILLHRYNGSSGIISNG